MSVIGEKLGEMSGRITTITVTEAGAAANCEWDSGELGTILETATFCPSVDATGAPGTVSSRSQAVLPDGTTLTYASGGTWRSVGPQRWEVKLINLASTGDRVFTVETWHLKTHTTEAVLYALD